MSNSLDPDQARLNVGPYLDPNCLQMLSEGPRVTNILILLECKEINLSMLILQHNILQGYAEPDQGPRL